MTRQPHARRIYLPSAEPPRDWRPWVEATVGLAAIGLLAFALLWLLPLAGIAPVTVP